tara:strand:- start:965 stop:1579 length:615 start_codon:yes stop_codon:yes gene_type:complete
MKKLILIIGILIGLTIGVSSQNDAKPLTEQDAEEISMMTNGDLSPEDIKTAVNNSHTVIFKEIKSSDTLNKKIEEAFLSLNKNNNDNNIIRLMDSLYIWSIRTNEMSFIIGNLNVNYGAVSRKYIKYKLQNIFISDFENRDVEIVSIGHRRISDTKNPKTGEYWRKDFYRIHFDIIENNVRRSFCEIDVNKGKIKNIDYYFNGY